MTTIIWKKATVGGTAKSRYKARRAEKTAQKQQDLQLSRKIARLSHGSALRVQKAILLASSHRIIPDIPRTPDSTGQNAYLHRTDDAVSSCKDKA